MVSREGVIGRGVTLVALVALVAAAACSAPTQPAGSVTVKTAIPLSPANGAQIANAAQPVTLTVLNATVTGSVPAVMYTFEVATDTAFANKVATKDVTQGSAQTALTLASLTGGADYYWHVRATAGDTVGGFTTPTKFTIGPAVVLTAPTVSAPTGGSTNVNPKPTLVVNNATKTGPPGPLSYVFEVSSSNTFASVLTSGTVPEGSGQTSFTLSAGLSPTTTYFWHARAVDTLTGVQGPFSAATSFTTGVPNPLWPGIQPPGTNGHAVKGDNWQPQTLVSFTGVSFASPPIDAQQVFDLIDRGMDPQSAIDWMHANGYSTPAAYFPSLQVIGFQFIYLTLINGQWDLVQRVGA